MQKDFLIVGFGLAGLSFASKLERNSKSFHIIDFNVNSPQRVIGGMYNPVILKRFTPAWKAHEMWLKSIETYQFFEKKFSKKYIHEFKILRILQSVEEQNNWVVASDKKTMSHYMKAEIFPDNIKGINAPFGFGEMKNVGRVEGEQILIDYSKELVEKEILERKPFNYDKIKLEKDYILYDNVAYKNIVFSEGNNISANPYFNYLPMKVSKGEMLIVEIDDCNFDMAFKSSCFMVPLGNKMYVVGATYLWDDFEPNLTASGKEELENKLKSFLKCNYKIIDFRAGIRPTVSDRRPLLGRHPKLKNLYILNGLGTRGIIYGPALATQLYDYIFNNKDLDEETDIKRFKELYKG